MMSPVRRLPRLALLVGIALLAGLSAGCRRPPAAEETPSPAPVKWEEARQFFVQEWTEILGTTQALPDRSARVTAPVEGQVVSVLPDAQGKPVTEGRLVQKGEVIVRLDDRLVQANRAKVEANRDEAKQHIKQAEL